MKPRILSLALTAALSTLSFASANAFDLPKMPGKPADTKPADATAATPAAVASQGQTALLSFTSAQLGLAEALGGYEELAAQRKLIENMKAGDPASKGSVDTLAKVSQSVGTEIDKKVTENAKLSAANRKIAAKATVEYVNGLLACRSVAGSVQGLARNPVALGSDAGGVLALGKNLPGVITTGTSTTGALFKYMAANDVDTSAATVAANNLGK